MADPFEVRIKFTHQLQHLNASINSAQKAAHYAIRHREMDEDLHSCILEQVERVSPGPKTSDGVPSLIEAIKNNMNNRANIMYFIEQLCDMSQREKADEFIRMIQRDILRIIDAVTPSDGTGAANIKVVRRVLGNLHNKGIFTSATIQELEECLQERDIGTPTPNKPAIDEPATPATRNNNGIYKPDKKQIEQRIEDDRARHKRLRESFWAVPGSNDKEYRKLMDELSDFGEDDVRAQQEESEKRRACYHALAASREAEHKVNATKQ